MRQVATLPPREDGYLRKKLSLAECRFLTSGGFLEPGKFELIEGEIVYKTGQGRIRILTVTRIIAALITIFGIDSIQSQAQIGIGENDPFNDPEPDVAVVRGDLKGYVEREPDPASDILLVVEASLSSLYGDRTTKASLYAKHGVPEYWVVAIGTRQLIVFRQPTNEGYADIQTYEEEDFVSPLSAPDSAVSVFGLLP